MFFKLRTQILKLGLPITAKVEFAEVKIKTFLLLLQNNFCFYYCYIAYKRRLLKDFCNVQKIFFFLYSEIYNRKLIRIEEEINVQLRKNQE